MSKVTSKLQVTIPKAVAERCGIRPGDVLEWQASAGGLRVVSGRGGGAPKLSLAERLELFDRTSARLASLARPSERQGAGIGRGWTRAELYERDGAR